jgi:hypothetical protein
MDKKLVYKYIKPLDGEDIISITRKSYWAYKWMIFVAIFLVFLPFFLVYPLFQWSWYGLLVFAVLLIIAIIIAYRAYRVINYTFLVITNKRIVDITQGGLLKKEVCQSLYRSIANVSYRQGGISGALAQMGEVIIYFSEADRGNIKMRIGGIKNPAKLADVIIGAQEEYQKNK